MEKIRSKKGITLIALVVTIIVLLILIGIVASELGTEDGILDRAVDAQEITGTVDIQERIKLVAMEALTEGVGTIKETDLERMLKREFGSEYQNDLEEHNGGQGGKYWMTTIKGTTAKIYASGEIKYPRWQYIADEENNNRKTKITDGKIELKIGDYINYSPTAGVDNVASLKYTSPVGTEHTSGKKRATESVTPGNGNSNQEFNAANYVGKWRVLGLDEEKDEILIMNEDVIQTTGNGNYYISGLTGARYGKEELDKVCKIYGKGKGATGARSITVEDINKITGYNPKNTGVYDLEQTGTGVPCDQGNLYEYGNEVAYEWKSDNDTYPYYKGKVGGEGYIQHISHKDYGFNWLDQKLEGHTKLYSATDLGLITKLKSSRCYYYPNTLTSNSSGTTKGIATDSKEYKMLFRNGTDTAGKGYWLASPYVHASEGGARFGLCAVFSGGGVNDIFLYNSYGGCWLNVFDVSAAVSLESNIQLRQVSKGQWEF